MNKYELVAQVSQILGKTIEVFEVADLKLEEGDMNILYEIHSHLDRSLTHLRQVRRSARLLLEQYEDDLTRKPEYINNSIDEDEDEDEDEDRWEE